MACRKIRSKVTSMAMGKCETSETFNFDHRLRAPAPKNRKAELLSARLSDAHFCVVG